MKKNFFYIAALAVITAACTNEDALVTVPANNGTSDVKMITETITATNGDANGATRAAIADADGAFTWSEGDKVAVHVSDGKYYTTEALTSSDINSTEPDKATFSVSYSGSRDAFAVFPASIVAADAANYGDGTALDVTLPSSYTLAQVSGTTTPCPMIATNTPGNGWEFYQLCGMLRLTVNSIPDDAEGIVIQFPGKKVNGAFSIASDVKPGTSTIVTGVPADGEDKITITFDAGITTATVNLPLPTGTYDNVFITPVNSTANKAAIPSIKDGSSYTAARARGKKLTTAMDNFIRFDLSNGSFNSTEPYSTEPYVYIYQSDAGTATSNTITIANNQKVLLDGVNIKAENTNAINCLGNAEIVLSGTNTVKSESASGNYSGVLNYAVIKAGAYEPTKTTLTISGNGSLNVSPQKWASATSTAFNGAGIGADYEGNCGNIVINSGTITVSGVYGAAIGSGRVGTGTSKCGSITINGGTINATGSTGAGIGSGGRMWVSDNRGTTSCDGITINGGTVTARSVGGAAIGAGKCEGGGTNSDSYCGDILITGGTVDARTSAGANGDGGAAIGGGYHSKAGNITISGGNVTAVGSSRSAGIGSGSRNSQCGNILINGGSVDAQGGYDFNDNEGAGIGTGKGYANNNRSICGTVTITNGVTIVKAYNVKGSSTKNNIGAGSAFYTSCGTVKINGVTGAIAGGSQYVYQPGSGS